MSIQKLNIFLQLQRFQALHLAEIKHKFLYIISQFLFYPANSEFRCFYCFANKKINIYNMNYLLFVIELIFC